MSVSWVAGYFALVYIIPAAIGLSIYLRTHRG